MAMDVNTNANLVYKHNFLNVNINSSAIESLTVKKFDSLRIDMILMSPPCQPFTRVGKQKDTEDIRTKSFLHVLDLLKRSEKCPSYILLENVKGFECSDSRMRLIETLKDCGYNFQELLLTPLQFGIPNSRLRYFLIAKKRPLQFSFQTSEEIMVKLNCPQDWLTYKLKSEAETQSEQLKREGHSFICRRHSEVKSENSVTQTGTGATSQHSVCKRTNEDSAENLNCKRQKQDVGSNVISNAAKGDNLDCESFDKEASDKQKHIGFCLQNSDCLENYGENMRQSLTEDQADYGLCLKLHHFLEDKFDSQDLFKEYLITEKDLKRFMVMDIVNPCSRKTCCFTKRYGHYIDGAGSLVQMSTDIQCINEASKLKCKTSLEQNRDQWKDEEFEIVRCLKLRYFTPREIANILCFPASFSFPEGLTNRQKYMLLGNSLNVHIVSVLLRMLTS
ncbi:tRNA (cytosine(38)-C(5))-methyltransferase-like isoform X2 [Mercenaria mercenaria]|nr:tRNA (cytosine(38)-C(5))-methyltransferase-like isoform X2 [Mercenaria mercenaria]XP_053384427.1 tRNA (cytosine(38)-C(5))-methyltransferase-like isoform X2 [Mercenaria mercenaria]